MDNLNVGSSQLTRHNTRNKFSQHLLEGGHLMDLLGEGNTWLLLECGGRFSFFHKKEAVGNYLVFALGEKRKERKPQ